ncbi:MAG: SHIRT domain-containing protein [Eubacterium sp.]|nr:SHIRT domain-containing protein [Eubacterium sp.]
MIRRKKIFAILVLALMLNLVFAVPNYAADVTVGDMQALKAAIGRGDSITLTNDIEVTESLEIPDTYNGQIKSNGVKLSLAEGVDNMFSVKSGANLTFDNIVFDGKENGRIIDAGSATITIKNSTIKNATTEKFKPLMVDNVNKQRYEGGAIYAERTRLNLEQTNFESNHTKAVVPSPGTPHGGAISSFSANITIVGGKFVNNYTGCVDQPNSSHGEGGAIKLHPGSKLTINDPSVTNKATTVFDGNHLDGSENMGGRQGGAIEATQSNVYIYGTSFKIVGPFNTGGAIKFEGSPEAIIKNSDFTIEGKKGTIGIAGGAITTENSKLSIDSSSFKANAGSRVAEAGGLIQVVGGGEFNLTNSTLEGSGAWWNGGGAGLYTANTGGAINFYNGSTVKANIEKTEIKNFMVDGAGAGISLAKSTGHKASVNLTMKNTNIINTATYVFNGNGHGGAMFVGSGNTVSIDGGTISSQTASNNAGGIFNEGSVTISGGAVISNNFAYNMVGGIYNDGYLKIDNATISNNKKGDPYEGYGHKLSKDEMSGINIYADKDVIITPNAKFDGNDIRILDGQSKILLTGALTKQLNVSISEKPKTTDSTGIFAKYIEDQERYIGYTVASGTDGYKATPADAQKIHYVSNDKTQAIATSDDHASIGKWDFVFNPESNTVVLGQRAKMTYHANFDDKNAKFKDNAVTKDQIYTFYGTGSGEPKVSIDNAKADYLQELDEKPTSKWMFDGWYNHNPVQPTSDNAVDVFRNTTKNDVSASKVNFTNAYFTSSVDKIKNIINPNELHVYAGWKPLEITLSKVWNDDGARDKASSAVLILKLGENGKTEEFTATRELTSKTFSNLDKFLEDGVTPVKYSVDESNVPQGYTKQISELKENGSAAKFAAVITNTKPASKYNVIHEFKAAQGVTIALPDTIKGWVPANQKDVADGTNVNPSDFGNKKYEDAANDGVWTFDSWDKNEDTINGKDVKFIGTWTFKKNEAPKPQPTLYKVVHEFIAVEGINVALPEAISNRTPADQADKADGSEVSPSAFDNSEYKDEANDGIWSFVSWNKPVDTINGKDVKFIGTWTFKKNEAPKPQPTLYKVVHEFIAAEGINVALPEAISNRTPADQMDKADGSEVSPGAFDNSEYKDAANDGVWTFDSWDKNKDTINGKDVKFVGTWNFKKNEAPKPQPGTNPDPKPNPDHNPNPEPKPPVPESKPVDKVIKDKKTPNTGDDANSIGYVIMLLTSLGATLAIRKKVSSK